MLYLPNSKLGFLHIPKTGGTFIKEAVKQLGIVHETIGPSHLDLEEAKKANGDDASYVVFVRFPPTLIQSYWAHRMVVGWGGDLPISHFCKDNNFNLFVRKVISRCPGFFGELITRYIGKEEEENKPRIGYYENLVEDLHEILESVGERSDLGLIRSMKRVNVTPTPLKKQFSYEAEVYDAFCESEKSIMERLGYEQDNTGRRREGLSDLA